MKWFSTCLWILEFYILCAIGSDLNNPPGFSGNVNFASYSGAPSQQLELQNQDDLLSAFRIHYRRFEQAVQEAMVDPTDPTVLARLGDGIDEFATHVREVSNN
jgi:hypothetical protein